MARAAQCATRLENSEYMSLRHCVFKIEPASANHTSRIVFETIDKKKHLYALLNGFHAEFSARQPGGADELRQLIKDARLKWAVQLRDTDRRDIEVIIAHEYHGQGIDRFVTARFKAIKQDLEAVGGNAYHQYPFNKKDGDRPWAVLCIVVPQAGIDHVLTEKRMTAHAITFNDITAPAADDYLPRQPDPGCQFWYRNADSSLTVLPTPKDTVRHRSSTIDRIRDAPPGAWDPYSRPQTVEQQQWPGRKPFSADVYEPESNCNWIDRDFATRCEQLEEYDKSKNGSPPKFDEDKDPYPSMSEEYPRNYYMHGGDKQSITDIRRDYIELEREIAQIEDNDQKAREALDTLVRSGTMSGPQIRISKQAHDALYADLELRKLPTLRERLGQVAASLMGAKSWPDQPKKRNTVIKQSANGSTIWEEPIEVNEEARDIPVGPPPTENKTNWWSQIQRMFAGAGRPKKAQTPAVTPPAVAAPALKRSDSAVSFSAGVAADVTTRGIGEQSSGEAAGVAADITTGGSDDHQSGEAAGITADTTTRGGDHKSGEAARGAATTITTKGGAILNLPPPGQASADLRKLLDDTGVPRKGENTTSFRYV